MRRTARSCSLPRWSPTARSTPFIWRGRASLGHALEEVFSHPAWWTSLSDVAGNVLLFVPMGVAIVVATDGRPNAGTWRAVWIVLSLALALLLQNRPGLRSVPLGGDGRCALEWRGAGDRTGRGKAARALMQRCHRRRPPGRDVRPGPRFWGGWGLWPFVPTIDFQHSGFAQAAPAAARVQRMPSPRWPCGRAAVCADGVVAISEDHTGRRHRAVDCGGPVLVGQTFGDVFYRGGRRPGPGMGALRHGDAAGAAAVLILLAMLWFTADSLRPFDVFRRPRHDELGALRLDADGSWTTISRRCAAWHSSRASWRSWADACT